MITSKNTLALLSKILAAIGFSILLSSCTAVTVVGAVAGAAVTVGTVAVKGTAAVVDLAIPDGDDEDKDKKEEDTEPAAEQNTEQQAANK